MDIVVDFFAGSGSTGHAVLLQNAIDSGNRHFVCTQLPEPLPVPQNSLKTIADITKERLRSAIKARSDSRASELPMSGQDIEDLGFRTFCLAGSNFAPWSGTQAEGSASSLETQLELHISHIQSGRSAEEILYEVLLKSGFSLTTHVETLPLLGKSVFSVAGGAMLICLERELTHDMIKSMADLHPERVVCLDEGFAGNDQLKTNAVQTMKARGVTSFRTV